MMTANTTRRAPPGFAIAVLVALCGAPSISEAASGVCNELVTMLDRTTAKEFQVNTDNIAAVTNGAYDSNGAIQAAMLASGAWNEQANAGLFEYAGIDTSRTDITNCATQPSIIVFVDGCCTVGPSFSCAAVSNSRCSGTKFKITVFK